MKPSQPNYKSETYPLGSVSSPSSVPAPTAVSKTKICTKCGKRKPLEDFVHNKNCLNGREGECKQCAAIRKKVHYKVNEKHYIDRGKAYYQDNKEQIRIKEKAYYEVNKEKILIQCKEYSKKNRDKIRNRSKNYYLANKAQISIKSKVYYDANKKQICQKTRELRKTKPERFAKYDEKDKARYLTDKKYRDHILAQCKKYRKHHKKEHNANSRKDRLELRDYYVKERLCDRTNLISADIPQELIEAKREYIKLTRLLKGIENENNQGSKRKIG